MRGPNHQCVIQDSRNSSNVGSDAIHTLFYSASSSSQVNFAPSSPGKGFGPDGGGRGGVSGSDHPETDSEAASEAPRTSVVYDREDRGIDKAENVCRVCCGSAVGRQASHGRDEEASGLSSQSVQTILVAYISVSFKISQAMD